MISHFVEVTHGTEMGNWGKFQLLQLQIEDVTYQSEVHKQMGESAPLLRQIGFQRNYIWFLDLQTLEGVAMPPPNGDAATHVKYYLDKHQIWVCLLYEPFVSWFWQQGFKSIKECPPLVELPDAPGGLHGYRRGGPDYQRLREVTKIVSDLRVDMMFANSHLKDMLNKAHAVVKDIADDIADEKTAKGLENLKKSENDS